MGCDIHLYMEQKRDGLWYCMNQSKQWLEEDYHELPSDHEIYSGRNYQLFGILAGVRDPDAQLFDVKGIPVDVSEPVKAAYDEWGPDGHSHSFLTMRELMSIEDFFIKVRGMKKKSELITLMASMESDKPDFDLMYPYCEWTSMKGYENFEIDVPASYFMRAFYNSILVFLRKKTKLLPTLGSDTVGAMRTIERFLSPDDFRIVFWFDN